MSGYLRILGFTAALAAAACGSNVNVQQETDALLATDRDFSAAAGDPDTFISFLAPDAAMYPTGMPVTTGPEAIRAMFAGMAAAPGFSVKWSPTKAEVSGDGTLGTTAGTYEMTMNGGTEHGKYVTTWRKIDGAWKAVDDIFNANEQPASPHVVVTSTDLTWGDAPPSLPPGAKLAVVSGDPTTAGMFVVQLQAPAGYKVAAHWHPTDENVTVLSGTFAVGMGEKFDEAALKTLPAGSYVALPATMRHFAMAKTASTIQISGMGPFIVNYVDPADDPSKMRK